MLKDENIPIQDCGEPLVELKPDEFVLQPIYFEQGIAQSDIVKLRRSVVEKLRKAQHALQDIEGWKIKIWDGFRLQKTQQRIYDDYYKKVKKENPTWSDGQINAEVIKFVSPANTNPNAPAPHNTGGAVDLTLVDKNGNEIEMGTDYDDFTEKARTNYYATTGANHELAQTFHRNRLLLKNILEATGLSNDPLEWWHFSYGDQEWAERTNYQHAIYGSAEA